MPLEEPAWWYGAGGSIWPRVLSPVGDLYGRIVAGRFRRAPLRAGLPVICVGNFTLGGTGKTPLVRHIVGRLGAFGRQPVVLTRGYGGQERGPHWVDAGVDSALRVGDEPLLLVNDAPVLVARDRAAGAAAIAARVGRGGVVVMDDGLQNPALAKDLSIAVLDGRRLLGNGRVFPAGPLRADLAFQVGLADAVVVNQPAGGACDADWLARFRTRFAKPVLEARVEPAEDTAWLRGRRVVAFAGIGHPARFFQLLEQLGAEVVATRAFADHQPMSEAAAGALLADAARVGADLVTTEKDAARLAGTTGSCGVLAERSRVLAIRLVFGEPDLERLDALLRRALAADRPTAV